MRSLIAAVLLLFVTLPASAEAQHDLRRVHESTVYTMVRIVTQTGVVGSGWLLQQSGRPLVVTNRHVVQNQRGFTVLF